MVNSGDSRCNTPSMADYPSMITEDIYLGDKFQAQNRRILQALNITHVLNVTKTVPNFFEHSTNDFPLSPVNNSTASSPTRSDGDHLPSGIQSPEPEFVLTYLRVPSDDVPDDAVIIASMNQIVHFMDDALQAKGRILIHCEQGISRSATASIAYFVHPDRMNLKEAVEFVKSKRTQISVNHGFFDQLRTYETSQLGLSSLTEYDYTRYFSKPNLLRFEDIDMSSLEFDYLRRSDFKLPKTISCSIM